MNLIYTNKKLFNSTSRINLMGTIDQQQLINSVFSKWSVFDTNERISILFYLRESFFRAMTSEQKERYFTIIEQELRKEQIVKGDLIELLGQLIKYVDFNVKSIIWKVLSIKEQLHKVKDYICIINFFKYAWDICDKEQCTIIRNMLTQKLPNSDLEIIAKDVLYAIESDPVCQLKGKFALVIPEFLTSATFLQQPLDYMRALSFLKENGLLGDIIDNRVHNYSLHHLAQVLEPYDTIIVTSSPIDMVQKYYIDYRYCIFCETVNWLHSNYPNKKIIVCGAHGTVDKNLLYKDICCNQVLSGECTNAIVSYLLGRSIDEEHLLKCKLQLDAVDMNWYYGRKVRNNITYRQKKYSIFQLSLGCPYHCIYCYNFYGHKVRRMPIEDAVSQLQQLKDSGIEHIFFIDQTFTLDNIYIEKLCREMCRRDFRFSWQCETRADLLTPSLTQLMKEAGCTTVWLGFESFSQEVLDANKKQLTNQQQFEAIHILQKVGIGCSGFVMFGMVGDTPDTIRDTINTILLHNIPTSRTANLCTVRIGTELYEMAKAADIIKIDSFCHLEAYRGRLFNSVTDEDLFDAMLRFSAVIG